MKRTVILAILTCTGFLFSLAPAAQSPATSPIKLTDDLSIFQSADDRTSTAAQRGRWTDDPLLSGTPIKAVHFTELRESINHTLIECGGTPFSFTDPTLTVGVTPIRALHVTELRRALDAAYAACGMLFVPTYLDGTLRAGATLIRAAHVIELRTEVTWLRDAANLDLDNVRVECSKQPLARAPGERFADLSVLLPSASYLLKISEQMTCAVIQIHDDGSEAQISTQWSLIRPLNSDDDPSLVAAVEPNGRITGLTEGAVSIDSGSDYIVHLAVEGDARFDEAFWRELAFNEHDCPTACGPIEQRLLWRLPEPSPNVFILTTHMPGDWISQIEEIAPRAIAEITGFPYTGRVVAGAVAAQRSEPGWITFEAVASNISPETEACEGFSGGGDGWSGAATLGAEIGCIVFNLDVASEDYVISNLIRHEIGHALGFYHTSRDGLDIMAVAFLGIPYSNQERHHARFAYTRQRGETYADIMLPAASGATGRASQMRPRSHGGWAVDYRVDIDYRDVALPR